jgi:hypothetical protein
LVPFSFAFRALSIAELKQQPFRTISVMPTAQEMDEALRSQRGFTVPSEVPRPPLETTAESLLEGHFRLLRHDMLGSAYEQLSERDEKRRRLHRINDTLYNLKPLQPNHKRGAEIAFRFSLHNEHPAARPGKGRKTPALDEAKIFKRGSLLLLRFENTIEHIARVAKTEPAQLAQGQVNLTFDDVTSLNFILSELTCVQATSWHKQTLTCVSDKDALGATTDLNGTQGTTPRSGKPGTGRTYTAIAFASSYFAYEPVLQRLQRMSSVPFAEELLFPDLSIPPGVRMPNASYWRNPTARDDIIKKYIALKKLNPSQAQALKRGAIKRVALIQGPPGTGKTYVGSALAELILLHGHQKILVSVDGDGHWAYRDILFNE